MAAPKTAFPFIPTTLPKLDYEAFAAAQQRNFDTFGTVLKLFADGVQAVLGVQAAALEGSLKRGAEAATEALATKDVGVTIQKQIELAQISAQKTFALSKEVADIAAKTGTQAFTLLRERAQQGVSEVNALLQAA